MTSPHLYGMSAVGDFHPQRTSITTKLMVAPQYRLTSVFVRLALASYKHALALGMRFDFMDCNLPLVPFFQGLGYRVHRGRITHPEYGEVISMMLDLEDVAHLGAVGSPFWQACAEHLAVRGRNIPFEQYEV